MDWKPSEPLRSIYYLTISLYIHDLIIYLTDNLLRDEKLIYSIYDWNHNLFYKNVKLEKKLMKHRSKIFFLGALVGFVLAL